MKIETKKEVLLNAIQKLQNIIGPKTTLPILANILLETQHNNLRLTATDLDIGISCVIPVNIHEPGAATIPAKRLNDIIRELPDNNVSIYTKKNNSVIIETDKCQFKIVGLSCEEFPKLPEFKDKEAIQLDQSDFKEIIQLVAFAVSVDESRYILNGILFKIEKNTLTLVATDGKRLAVAERKLKQNTDKEVAIIVPIKTIHELNRNLKEGELSLLLSANQALFDLGGLIIVSRLIEGEFPDYKQVIPPVSENAIGIGREQFLLAARRAALLSTPDYQAAKMEVFKNKLVISKSTPDIGESREELSVEYQGGEIVVGFNPVYLIDVLKNLREEKISFEVTDSEKPGVIRLSGYTYIVLPMRLG